MLKTSYFARVKQMPEGLNVVSIARMTPPGFPGKQCPELMPSSDLLWGYKNKTVTQDQYRERYLHQLSLLDPQAIIAKYGEDAIFICYEGIGKFCHRNLVAEWFRSHGYEIEEWSAA